MGAARARDRTVPIGDPAAKSYGARSDYGKSDFGFHDEAEAFPHVAGGRRGGAAAVRGRGAGQPGHIVRPRNGRVISHQDAFKRWYPASLSKLMTAYVAFRALAGGEVQLDSPIRMTGTPRRAALEDGLQARQVMRLDNA